MATKKTNKKPKVQSEQLIVKVYPILCEAIESGINYGWIRAHKHDDAPTEEYIKEQIHEAVLNDIFERFDIKPDIEEYA